MIFEWDEDKHERALRLRGIGFELASAIFARATLDQHDGRRDDWEIRIIAIGEAEGQVLTVVFTDRGSFRRIISARRANRKERRQWQPYVSR